MELFAGLALIGMALAFGLKEIADAIKTRTINLNWNMERSIRFDHTIVNNGEQVPNGSNEGTPLCGGPLD